MNTFGVALLADDFLRRGRRLYVVQRNTVRGDQRVARARLSLERIDTSIRFRREVASWK